AVTLISLLFLSFSPREKANTGGPTVTDKSREEILKALKASAPDDQPRKADGHYGIKIGSVLVPETVAIPAGSFNMGQPNKNANCFECSKDEQPVHRIAISTFELGRFEITNAQYHAFSVATERENAEWRQYFIQGKEDYPVMNITWNDAQEY